MIWATFKNTKGKKLDEEMISMFKIRKYAIIFVLLLAGGDAISPKNLINLSYKRNITKIS